MPGRAAASVLALAGLAGAAQAQVQRGSQPLSVGEIRNELAGDTKVGSLRAGLVCGPAGALRWREVEPRARETRVALTRVLKEGGLAIDGPADDWLDYRAGSTGFRLIAAVAGLEMRACTPSVGLMKTLERRHRLKGDGVMQVEWRIYRLADRAMVATTRTCAAFAFDSADLALADAVVIGLGENARLIGRELSRAAPALVLPPTLGLPAGGCPDQSARQHRSAD